MSKYLGQHQDLYTCESQKRWEPDMRNLSHAKLFFLFIFELWFNIVSESVMFWTIWQSSSWYLFSASFVLIKHTIWFCSTFSLCSAVLLKMPRLKALHSIFVQCGHSLLIWQLDQRKWYYVLLKCALFFHIDFCSLRNVKRCTIHCNASNKKGGFWYKIRNQKIRISI